MKKYLLPVALLAALSNSASAGLINASGLIINEEIHDYYFSVTSLGLVTIDVTETVAGDPVDLGNFDTEINLFFDDGVLDLSDFIENDDDHGLGLESYISRVLDAGDYLLRIGSHNFGNSSGTDANIIAAVNTGGHHGYTDYDLAISGDYVTSTAASVPEPGSLLLLSAGIAALGFSRKAKAS